MARMKVLSMGVLNVKTQPHSPQKYYDLFVDLFKIKPLVKIRGADYATPAILTLVDGDEPLSGICGRFYKIMEIDQTKPWLDLDTHVPIVTEDGKPIPQVERNKFPNTKELEFVFYPRGHRLFFNCANISPRMAHRLVSEMMSDGRIKKKYGIVDVEIENSLEAIDRILRIPILTKLNIKFTRPNDDDLGEVEERFLKRMYGQNIRKIDQNLSSDKENGIYPDDETKALMNIAVSNGEVSAEGYKGEEKVTESTEPHPYIERQKYDPNLQTFMAAMIEASSNILGRFTRRRK